MKYFFFADQNDLEPFSVLLKQQIPSLDFRAEFECIKRRVSTRSIKKKMKSFQPDILIIGKPFRTSQKLILYAREHGIKTCLLQDFPETKELSQRALKNIDLILLTRQAKKTIQNAHYIGNPVLDQIKNYEFDSRFSLDESKTNIVLISNSKRIIKRVVKSVGEKYKLHIISGVSKSEVYEHLKHCNAAIIESDIPSLEAVFLNCPQVILREKKTGIFKPINGSLVNSLAEKDIVKELTNPKLVANELKKILNDQQYCATMLAEYQILKDEIGSEKASKNAARLIVDFLESSGS